MDSCSQQCFQLFFNTFPIWFFKTFKLNMMKWDKFCYSRIFNSRTDFRRPLRIQSTLESPFSVLFVLISMWMLQDRFQYCLSCVIWYFASWFSMIVTLLFHLILFAVDFINGWWFQLWQLISICLKHNRRRS